MPIKISNLMADPYFLCPDNTSVTITWDESQTLDVTHTAVDVYYRVELYYRSPDTIIDINITETHYTVDLNKTEVGALSLSCSPLQIRVTPFNSVGYGNSCSVDEFPLDEGKIPMRHPLVY